MAKLKHGVRFGSSAASARIGFSSAPRSLPTGCPSVSCKELVGVEGAGFRMRSYPVCRWCWSNVPAEVREEMLAARLEWEQGDVPPDRLARAVEALKGSAVKVARRARLKQMVRR